MRGGGCGGSSGGGSCGGVCGGGSGAAANPLRPMKYNRRERWHTATADRQLYFYAHTLVMCTKGLPPVKNCLILFGSYLLLYAACAWKNL